MSPTGRLAHRHERVPVASIAACAAYTLRDVARAGQANTIGRRSGGNAVQPDRHHLCRSPTRWRSVPAARSAVELESTAQRKRARRRAFALQDSQPRPGTRPNPGVGDRRSMTSCRRCSPRPASGSRIPRQDVSAWLSRQSRTPTPDSRQPCGARSRSSTGTARRTIPAWNPFRVEHCDPGRRFAGAPASCSPHRPQIGHLPVAMSAGMRC